MTDIIYKFMKIDRQFDIFSSPILLFWLVWNVETPIYVYIKTIFNAYVAFEACLSYFCLKIIRGTKSNLFKIVPNERLDINW